MEYKACNNFCYHFAINEETKKDFCITHKIELSKNRDISKYCIEFKKSEFSKALEFFDNNKKKIINSKIRKKKLIQKNIIDFYF